MTEEEFNLLFSKLVLCHKLLNAYIKSIGIKNETFPPSVKPMKNWPMTLFIFNKKLGTIFAITNMN